VFEAVREAGLQALVVTRDGGFRYLAGTQVVWRSAVIVPAQGEPIVVTPREDRERVLAHSWLTESATWTITSPESFIDAVADVLRDLGATQRVGVDFGTGANTGALTATEYLGFLKRLPSIQLVDGVPVLDAVMGVKEPFEIELLHRAAEVADLGMLAAFDSLRPGRSELEVAGIAEAAMRIAGSEFTWSVTGTEVGSGRNQDFHGGVTSLPTRKLMQHGDMVTLDMHPMVNTYLGDFCLNAVIGRPSAEQLALARGWKAVFDHLFIALRPGARIDSVCRDAFTVAQEYGVKDLLAPWFGHGLGTDARIPKVLAAKSSDEVAVGDVMVILVQTNARNVGGMRVELPVVIAQDRTIPLNRVPIGLYCATSSGVELVPLD
jgi:Xaa-Pro aminopeptidase